MTRETAHRVAEELDVGLDIPICLACLSFVSMAIDEGDPREIARQVRQMTPALWDEGLKEPALEAARRGAAAGRSGARAALDDLERNGGRSIVARAIVERLGGELSAQVHREMNVWSSARRAAPGGGAPELN